MRASPASWPTSITACRGGRRRPSPPAGPARPICRSRSAMRFSTPVPFLAVTGNVPTSQFNRGAFQELYRHYQADFPSTVRSYCKKVFQPTRGEMVPLAVRQAWKTMTTGPARAGGARRALRRVHGSRPPRKRRTRKPGTPIFRAAAAPIRKASVKAVDMLLGAERPVDYRRPGRALRRRGGGAAEARRAPADPGRGVGQRPRRASIATIRWRWGSSRAAATTRPTTRRGRPTCLLAIGHAVRRPHLELVDPRLFLHDPADAS